MTGNRTMAGAVAGWALASGVSAVDRHVPGEYPTIQAAIDAAVNGDTIRLAAGEFVESAVIVGKSLAIRGAGMDQTTWRSAANARCLYVPAPQAAVAVEVSDLSVTGHGMPYSAAAVDIESAGANRVSRVRFHDNGGWATLEVFGVGATVEHCIFERNAHAVSVAHAPESRVTGCQFVQNGPGTQSGWSDMIFFEVSTVVEDCLFWGSTASMAPITNWHTVVFDSCTFVDLSGGYASVSEGVPGTGTQYRDNRFCGCPVPRFAQQYIDLGGNVFSNACGDCDEDGTPDAVEIYRGQPDTDGDGIPDECNCPGDVDSSGAVNAVDIAVILGVWGTSGGKYPGADVDGSGVVDAVDLGAVLAGWGPCG